MFKVFLRVRNHRCKTGYVEYVINYDFTLKQKSCECNHQLLLQIENPFKAFWSRHVGLFNTNFNKNKLLYSVWPVYHFSRINNRLFKW